MLKIQPILFTSSQASSIVLPLHQIRTHCICHIIFHNQNIIWVWFSVLFIAFLRNATAAKLYQYIINKLSCQHFIFIRWLIRPFRVNSSGWKKNKASTVRKQTFRKGHHKRASSLVHPFVNWNIAIVFRCCWTAKE